LTLPSAIVVSFLSAAFFSFSVFEDLRDVVTAKTLGSGDERAVARDLIVFDRLAGDDDGRIQHILVVDFARDIAGFLDDAIDGRTLTDFGFWPGIWNPCSSQDRYLVGFAACCWPRECGETVRSDMKSATARDMAKAEIETRGAGSQLHATWLVC
jgi:hypothetical protein